MTQEKLFFETISTNFPTMKKEDISGIYEKLFMTPFSNIIMCDTFCRVSNVSISYSTKIFHQLIENNVFIIEEEVSLAVLEDPDNNDLYFKTNGYIKLSEQREYIIKLNQINDLKRDFLTT